jgi:hypothetical protein
MQFGKDRQGHLLVLAPILVEAAHEAAPRIEAPVHAAQLALPALPGDVPHQKLHSLC